MKFSNTIPSSFYIANETAKKYSESRDFLSVCETVARHFRDVPWSFDEDQMARGLSLNIYNYLQTRLCLRYDGVTNIEIPQPDGMTDLEKAAVEFLYNQVSQKIDVIVERKKAKADKCREAGKKGGRPKKATVSADGKGDVSSETKQEKGSPFFNDVNTCEIEIKNIKNQDSESFGEKGDYRGIREKKFLHTSRRVKERKGLRGKRGEGSLPPYIPPVGIQDDGKRDGFCESAPEVRTVYTIERKTTDEDLQSAPRRKWQKRYSHFVTDLGATWEAFRNVGATEALLAIPCPPDFNIWLPIVISAKRGGVPDAIIDAWSRTGGHYDEDENEYYINYAKRERAGGITVLLLFRVYNYGFDCVGRFSNILKSEMARNGASSGKTDSAHANMLSVLKNAAETPSECEFTIAAPKLEPSKPEVALVSQIPPQNGVPTEDEKHSVLAEYMVNIRGLDMETVEHFGDEAKWDAYRKSWYIAIKEDGYETKRYLDVPPDSKCADKKHPRYMVTKNAGLKNHHSEHLFAQDNETVFLVEGQFDVRALWCAGRYLAVGVKNLDQLEADLKSSELTALNFVIVSDRDSTGEGNAAKWSKLLAENGFTPHVCRLPEGVRDVSEMLKKQGKSTVFKYIEDFMVKEGITAPVSAESADCPF